MRPAPAEPKHKGGVMNQKQIETEFLRLTREHETLMLCRFHRSLTEAEEARLDEIERLVEELCEPEQGEV